MSDLQHFLLVFDHAAGVMLDLHRFGSDGDAALLRYAEVEKEYRNTSQVDIVLIGSDSLETVKVTHANYFDEPAESKYFADLV